MPPAPADSHVIRDPDLKIGLAAVNAGDFTAAAEAADRYVARAGVTSEGELMLGLIEHKQKRYELAKPHFEKCIELDPSYPAVYHFQGYCLSNLGELDAARAAFETHLEFAPDEADTHFGIALIDLEEDKIADAERRLRRAIALNEQAQQRDPANRAALRDLAKCRARLADVHLRRDELLQARQELTLAVNLWPDHYEAWHKLHTVLVRLNEPKAAEEALRMHDLVKQRLRPAPEVPPLPEQQD